MTSLRKSTCTREPWSRDRRSPRLRRLLPAPPRRRLLPPHGGGDTPRDTPETPSPCAPHGPLGRGGRARLPARLDASTAEEARGSPFVVWMYSAPATSMWSFHHQALQGCRREFENRRFNNARVSINS
ncbi:unnamed protein product [Lampetra planeri]